MPAKKPELSPLLVKALTQYPTRVEFGRAIREHRMTIWDWENKTGYIPAVYAGVIEDLGIGITCRQVVDEAHARRGLGQLVEG
jgi:hypothetical protein